MVKKVLKFGGTSVGTVERIQHVANIIKKEHFAGNEVIAVVSAMSGKTNELINFSKDISEEFNKRDVIQTPVCIITFSSSEKDILTIFLFSIVYNLTHSLSI